MLKAADVVALAFGSSSALFTKETSDFEEKLVLSFQKNLTLLIQKTWVEKEDADLKEQNSSAADFGPARTVSIACFAAVLVIAAITLRATRGDIVLRGR